MNISDGTCPITYTATASGGSYDPFGAGIVTQAADNSFTFTDLTGFGHLDPVTVTVTIGSPAA